MQDASGSVVKPYLLLYLVFPDGAILQFQLPDGNVGRYLCKICAGDGFSQAALGMSITSR